MINRLFRTVHTWSVSQRDHCDLNVCRMSLISNICLCQELQFFTRTRRWAGEKANVRFHFSVSGSIQTTSYIFVDTLFNISHCKDTIIDYGYYGCLSKVVFFFIFVHINRIITVQVHIFGAIAG